MRFVGAIIVNPEGLLLLQQRDRSVKKFPGSWTLFGGKIKKNESPEQALLRELHEEIRLAPTLIRNFWLFHTHTQKREHLSQYIYVVHTTAKIEELELHEGQSMEYFRADEVNELDLAYNISDFLMRYQKIA